MNTCGSIVKPNSLDGMVVGSVSSFSQETQANVSYCSILKYEIPLSIVQEALVINVPLGEEDFSCVEFILHQVLVCIFNGFMPQLIDLRKWISDSWKPLFSGDMNIHPLA